MRVPGSGTEARGRRTPLSENSDAIKDAARRGADARKQTEMSD